MGWMKRASTALVIGLFAITTAQAQETVPYALAIHGGAGGTRGNDAVDERARIALKAALEAGESVLAAGGDARDAVVAAIVILENERVFNAGLGAVLDETGQAALDTSLMDGKTLKVGAATGLRHIPNPILLARAIMDHSSHVMFWGEGAEAFAKSQGIDFVEPSYFQIPTRVEQLKRAKERAMEAASKAGTVGAVARDKYGNLAAGTSTGGFTNKGLGRIGDSPIIGSGTYANNASCAVSATGDGEYFIRATAARDICALIEFKGLTAANAADQILNGKIKPLGGTGGVIVIDHQGNIALPYNTERMARGMVREGSGPHVALYPEDGE